MFVLIVVYRVLAKVSKLDQVMSQAAHGLHFSCHLFVAKNQARIL